MYDAAMTSGDKPLGTSNSIPTRFGLEDRLLAEAMRRFEEAGGNGEDASASELAVRIGGDFERRIIVRARAHQSSEGHHGEGGSARR